MMSFRLRIASLRILLVVVLLSLGSLRAQGQESPKIDSPQNPNNPTNSPNPSGSKDPAKNQPFSLLSGDWQLLKGPDGQFLPVQNNDELLKWLKQKHDTKEAVDRPLYSFSDVNLEGTTTDEEASLSMTLSLQITEESSWVRVPLGLNEAVLKGFQHEFKPAAGKNGASTLTGQACFASYNRRTTGYQWWFQGKGLHVLTLKATVSLKKASGVRRLQLAVPTAASSYLRLAIPIAQEQLSLETVAGGVHKTKAVGKQSSQVELFRLGQQLDLGWRSLPDARRIDTLLKAETKIRVEPTEESILLNASQWIEPLQGSMKEVEVSLPGGFQVVELKVDGDRYPLPDQDPETKQPVKITLPSATTDRLRLDWILQSPWPGTGQLILEGFHVAKSLRQSGEIAIVGFEGYRITKRSATDVYRTNVRELLGPGPIFSAYQFRQQPFQLVLELQQIQPSYSIRPHLFMKMGEQQVVMLVDLEMEVFRGVVQSLEISWPEFEEQGWKIDQAELPGIVEQIETDPETGNLRVQLGKRLSQGEPIRLQLRANRMVENPEEEFPLTLPRVIASNPVRTVVVVTNRENVESRVSPLEETQTQPLSANLAEKVEQLMASARMRDFRGPRQQAFLVRSPKHRFRGTIMTHPQSIQCDTWVKVILREDQSTIEQELRFDVNYEPATKLRVLVPASFPSPIQFSLGPMPIPFEWTGVKVGNSREAVLELPEPKLNEFSLVARYPISQVDQENLSAEIPLVRASEAEQITGRFESTSDYHPELVVEDSRWNKGSDAQGLPIWTTTSPGESLSVKWSARQDSDIQNLNIPKSLIQSVIQRNGQVYSLAHYLLDRPVQQVLISLDPDQILPDAFYWNGLELGDGQVSQIDAELGTYRLELPRIDSAGGVKESSEPTAGKQELVVAYHTTGGVPLNWSQHFRLASPSFPGDVWAEKTVWEVTLPVEQHLFTLPEKFTPAFSWVRQGAIWSRISHELPGSSHSWIALRNESTADGMPKEGNTYRFSYFGPCPLLNFSSMNRSIVVLFGAGLSLFIGFLLLKIPATRNVLTILLALFAFALCNVWFAAPMQLLSQPAALGLFLAIVAVLMDRTFKRQTSSSVSLSGPREYHGSTAQPMPTYPDPIGSEDPTAVRALHDNNSDSAATPQISGHDVATPPADLIGSSISEKSE